MNVLISNDFKALRAGEFVTASEDSNEFILDTENCDLACATLLEIADANKIPLKKGKKNDMVSDLETGLLKLNLPEMSKMSETDQVKQIVTDGFAADQSDEQMIIQILEAKIPFRRAGKLFRQVVESLGLRISVKARAEAIEAILEDNEFYPEKFEEVQAMCERIAVGDKEAELEPVADTTTQQAMKAIKKFLKVKEIEFPKAPKKAKGGLRLRFLTFAAANPAATDEELATWYMKNTKDKSSSDVEKWMKKYSATINHGRAIAQFCLDNEVVPAPVTVEEVAEETEKAA